MIALHLSTLDAITCGSHTSPRMITFRTAEGELKKVTKEQPLPPGAVGYIDPELYYPSHVATDFYHHYKEDIALFAEMGLVLPNVHCLVAHLPQRDVRGQRRGTEILRRCLR